MAQGALEDAIDRLYEVSLEAFVSERTRLAKELRSGGEKSAADQVAKLAKPTAAAWALNHVAREEPEVVEEWLEATAALRDASTRAAQVGGDTLRAAMAEHREATGRLIDVVRDRARPTGRPLSGAMLDRVRTLLQSATADARLAERLRIGRVTEEKSPIDVVPEPTAEREGPAAAASPGRAPKRDPEAAARAKRRAELERRVGAAREQVERLREEAAARKEVAGAAEERLQDARRALHRAESEAAAAADALKDADDATAAAQQELEQLEAHLRDAADSG
jgi:hypothetical protein